METEKSCIKKQTAVQWLIEQLDLKKSMYLRTHKIIDQAIQMEQEQIEDVAMYHRDSAVEIECIRSYIKKQYQNQYGQ